VLCPKSTHFVTSKLSLRSVALQASHCCLGHCLSPDGGCWVWSAATLADRFPHSVFTSTGAPNLANTLRCGPGLCGTGSDCSHGFSPRAPVGLPLFHLPEREDGRGGTQRTNGLKHLLKTGPVYACEVTGVRHDTGNKLGFLKAVVYFALRRPDLAGPFRDYLKTLPPATLSHQASNLSEKT